MKNVHAQPARWNADFQYQTILQSKSRTGLLHSGLTIGVRFTIGSSTTGDPWTVASRHPTMGESDSVHVSGNAASDLARRRFLTYATAGVATVGLGFAAIPFIESWLPSESARALGGPVSVDWSKIAPAQMIVVTWRRKPIYIVRRTAEMLALLRNHDDRLKDARSRNSQQPAYAANVYRSIRPDLFVTIGICTHLGCLPKARFQPGAPALGGDWPGGFFCPCHGSRFDLAGRVFEGSPASVNLVIPPYEIEGDRVTIGRGV